MITKDKTGYKQTELGLIPENWNIVPFIDFAVLQRGFDLPVQNRKEGSFPIVASNGIIGYHSEFKIKGPGVITGRSGSLGYVTYIEENYWPLNTSLFVSDFHKNYEKYVYYFIAGFNIERFGTGTGVPTLNRNNVHPTIIAVPPFSEQQKIAQILSTWDKAIEKKEKLIEVKQKLKKALMQQLLTGKKRFKGFSEKWRKVKLGDVFTERNETGFNDLKLLSITSKEGVIDRDDLDKKDTSNSDKSKYKRILPGDIGYNTMRLWQGVSGLSKMEGIVSPAYTIVTPSENIDPLFMSYFFKYEPTINLFHQYSQGLVSDTLNCKFNSFSKIEVLIPSSKEEQEEISKLLNISDKEIELLKKELETLKKQKKGLMQKLLTGKIRVNVANE